MRSIMRNSIAKSDACDEFALLIGYLEHALIKRLTCENAICHHFSGSAHRFGLDRVQTGQLHAGVIC